jgi:hypothetical protein
MCLAISFTRVKFTSLSLDSVTNRPTRCEDFRSRQPTGGFDLLPDFIIVFTRSFC